MERPSVTVAKQQKKCGIWYRGIRPEGVQLQSNEEKMRGRLWFTPSLRVSCQYCLHWKQETEMNFHQRGFTYDQPYLRSVPTTDQWSMRKHTNIRTHVFCTRFRDQKTHSTWMAMPPQTEVFFFTIDQTHSHLNGHTPQTEVYLHIENRPVTRTASLQSRNGNLCA